MGVNVGYNGDYLIKNHIKILTILFIIFACARSFAGESHDYFYMGNIAYEKGDFKEAVRQYEDFLSRGYESGNIYYNLGNAYFKLGNLGKSVLYYEKALKLMPNDADTVSNLAFVRTNLEDRPEDIIGNWFLKRLNFFFFGISLDALTIICAVFYWLACILGTVYLFLRYRWFTGWKYTMFFTIAFLIIFIILAIRLVSVELITYGIVTNKEVEARYGPTEGDAAAFTLHEGSKVRIENTIQNWYQVYFSSGKAGWVRKNSVEII